MVFACPSISKSMKHTYRIFVHYNILHINRIVYKTIKIRQLLINSIRTICFVNTAMTTNVVLSLLARI